MGADHSCGRVPPWSLRRHELPDDPVGSGVGDSSCHWSTYWLGGYEDQLTRALAHACAERPR